MENVVAARRLRKSMLKEMNNKPSFKSLDDIGIPNDIYTHGHIHENIDVLNDSDDVKKEKRKINFKTKIIIKSFSAVVIVFSCLICKLFFADSLKSNKYVQMLINQYNIDYTKEQIIEKSESIIEKGYTATKYIIPEALANNIKNNYITNIKPNIVNFDLKQSVLAVFKQDKKQEEKSATENVTQNNEQVEKEEQINNNEVLNGIGGGEPLQEKINTQEEAASAVSIMQDDVSTILSKNINIKQPVSGTITSTYGAREQIFDQVNPYHTGLDIANKLNTPILSATEGTVTKTQENDKYYGNNVEVTINGVIFKYAHMNSINVKQGQNVDQNSILGYMGSTGMSTGSHLHWEIKIDSRTVDPQQIIKIN